jgi:hypothetical protein
VFLVGYPDTLEYDWTAPPPSPPSGLDNAEDDRPNKVGRGSRQALIFPCDSENEEKVQWQYQRLKKDLCGLFHCCTQFKLRLGRALDLRDFFLGPTPLAPYAPVHREKASSYLQPCSSQREASLINATTDLHQVV